MMIGFSAVPSIGGGTGVAVGTGGVVGSGAIVATGAGVGVAHPASSVATTVKVTSGR